MNFYETTIVEKGSEPKYDNTYHYTFTNEKNYTYEKFKQHIKEASNNIKKLKIIEKKHQHVTKEELIKNLIEDYGYKEIEPVGSIYLYEYDEYDDEEDDYFRDISYSVDRNIP